jgi:hypothetical protein
MATFEADLVVQNEERSPDFFFLLSQGFFVFTAMNWS